MADKEKKDKVVAKKAAKQMRAIALLGTSATVKQRSIEYATTIKRNLGRTILDAIQAKIDRINEQIFEAQDFTLETNLNSGKSALTRGQCEERFEKVINLEYEKELLTRELRIKTDSYNSFFAE